LIWQIKWWRWWTRSMFA